MPSSTGLGSRPRLSTSASYSSQKRATSFSLRSLMATLISCSNQLPSRLDHRPEEKEAVGAAHLDLGAALGVGHHPEHVAALVDDAGDVVDGPVGVGGGNHEAALVGVAEDDLAALLQARQRGRVGEVVALAVGDRDPQHLSALDQRREGGVLALADEVGPLAAELEPVVADQGAREQAGLAEDLEPVADAPDQATGGDELGHRLHHRREARDGPGSQVVAMAELAGQDHAVDAVEVAVLVPEVAELGSQHLVDHPSTV